MGYPIYGDPTSFEETIYTIYLHRNKINNKVYIGQTRLQPEKRWGTQGQGYKKQPYFWSAIQKYGWDNFEHDILAYVLNQEDADKEEQYWIQFFNSNNADFGYNLTIGGQGSRKLSSDNLARKKKAIADYWASDKGKIQAKKHSLEVMGKNNPMYGKHHTEESKRKISESVTGMKNPNYGKHFTDEHKAKISESNKGKHNNQFGTNNPNAKPIFCIELDKYYGTVKEAVSDFKVSYKTLLRRLKDGKPIKGKYHLIYVKEEEYYE